MIYASVCEESNIEHISVSQHFFLIIICFTFTIVDIYECIVIFDNEFNVCTHYQ